MRLGLVGGGPGAAPTDSDNGGWRATDTGRTDDTPKPDRVRASLETVGSVGPVDEADLVVAVGVDALADRTLTDRAPATPVLVVDGRWPVGVTADRVAPILEWIAGRSPDDTPTVACPRLGASVTAVDGETDEATTATEVSGRATLDVTLTAAEPARISEFGVSHADAPLFDVRADGIVIATPAGSIGYASAAGGPRMVGGRQAAVVPMAPFAVDVGAWTVPMSAPLRLTVERDETPVALYVDGHRRGPVPTGHAVTVRPVGTFTVIDGREVERL